MAKGYHLPTPQNPFAGGRKPIWPKGMSGKGNAAAINVPRVLKEDIFKIAKIFASFVVGEITKQQAIEMFTEVLDLSK